MKSLYTQYKSKLEKLHHSELQSIIEKTAAKDAPSAQLSSTYEYAILFGEYPNPTVVGVPNCGISRFETEKYLKDNQWELLKLYGYVSEKNNNVDPFGQLWVNMEKQVILHISYMQDTSENFFYGIDLRQHEMIGDVSMGIETNTDKETTIVVSDIIIKHPPVMSNKYDADFILKVSKDLMKFKHEENKEAKIKIVSSEGGDYSIKNFSLANKTPNLTHLDLHYGVGFSDFNNSLLKRLESNVKGLILFHGEPGTGKTHYIRYLLAELSKINKTVIYFSPSMASQITQPAFMSFLSNWITENEKDVILLIEDAEPLLQTRTSGDRSEGITNLLNMTDGILNDMLGVTVICTFNTEVTKIDSALLRPERLIARKYFEKLTELDCYELSKALEIPEPECDSYPISLAEFYSKKKELEILEHGLEKKDKSIGFKR